MDLRSAVGAQEWPSACGVPIHGPTGLNCALSCCRFVRSLAATAASWTPPEIVTGALASVGLSASFVDLLDDASRYAEFQVKTDEALSLAGKDVGTPIAHFQPQHGWLSAGR